MPDEAGAGNAKACPNGSEGTSACDPKARGEIFAFGSGGGTDGTRRKTCSLGPGRTVPCEATAEDDVAMLEIETEL